jgi:peptide/nickel transport system substrate-binding protein
MNLRTRTLLSAGAGVAAVTLALTACTAGPSEPGEGDFVSGGTFVKAIGADPGNLNPFKVVNLDGWEVVTYAYESLVYVTADGEFVPWLAESWEETGTEVTYTLKDGITCDDGSEFTAETAANNINYNTQAANATFYYGSQVTEAVAATADGNTLTVTSEINDPFLMANTGTIYMTCQPGLDDPESLGDSTNGTGLYFLSDVKTGDTYTFDKRSDYTWGPDGVTSETVGLPDNLEVRVVADESTRANLLLSGEINAATVLGPDRARLDGAGLEYVGVRNSVGEMLFNEREGRILADQAVREALTLAINQEEVADVVSDGAGLEAVSLVTKSPFLCVADPPAWSLPAQDLDKAAQLLDEAGWELGADGTRSKDGQPLAIKFIYDAATPTHGPAAELVKQNWDELGVVTELHANDSADWSEQLFSTFDWDTGFIQLAPGAPTVLSTFFGPTPEEGGLNFMFVHNDEYDALAAEAKQSTPEEACGIWQDAETALIERVDVFPLIDNIVPSYQSGAVFERPNYIPPTSIRMLG